MVASQQSSTKKDILQRLLKQGQATALELAESLKISPQAIRRHLKDLEGEGLIEYQSPPIGMGRPQHIYKLTPRGRDRFPHRYDEFAISVLDTLAETVGPDGVKAVLHKQWQRKAMQYAEFLGNGPLPERLTNLVQLRQAEGYMAEWYPVTSDTADGHGGDRYIFMEHNCAISNVAESFPSVCGHELDMFAAVLSDCTVERTHWLVNGEHRCGYLITPLLIVNC